MENNPVPQPQPKIIKVISVALFLLAIYFLLKTIYAFGMIIILNNGLARVSGLEFQFLKITPWLGVLPLITIVGFSVYTYAASVNGNGSRRSFFISLITLILLPVIFFITGIIATLFVNKSLNTLENTQSQPQTLSPANLINFLLALVTDPLVLFSLVVLFLLMISYKKYSYPDYSLSAMSKKILIVVTSLLLIIFFGFNFYGLIKINDKDYGYASAQKQVNYKLYKPQLIPSGREYATAFFTNKEIDGITNAVRVSFDIPLNQRLEGKKQPIIVINQVGVAPNFNLDDHISKYFKDYNMKIISLNSHLAIKAYLLENPKSSLNIRAVVMLTTDHVLVVIISPGASELDLIQMAQSLQ